MVFTPIFWLEPVRTGGRGVTGLFGMFKEALRGGRCSCDDVKPAVHQWLYTVNINNYFAGAK